MLSCALWFLVGAVGGAVTMFLVYRNNTKKFQETEANLRKEVSVLKDRAEKVVDVAENAVEKVKEVL